MQIEIPSQDYSLPRVSQDTVCRVYDRLAASYDLIFGPALHAGRLRAVERMGIAPGDQVLEVGIGTGLSLDLYPRDSSVTGIDLSGAALARARERVARKKLDNVRLCQMDAGDLKFPDAEFDIVLASYVVSVVPDPVGVVREMRRVCRPGGQVIILNHFRSSHPWLARIERGMAPFTARHAGFQSDLDLHALLAETGLTAGSIEKVNLPQIWSLVSCVNRA